jgi:SnoaL-like domain
MKGGLSVDALARLAAAEEIKNLKARYFRCMDTKQWEELRGVFTPDMKVISPDGKVWLEGGDAFAASLKNSLERSVSAHQGFSPEIQIIDDQNAKGIWPMQDVIKWEDRHPREGWKSIVGRGHYHDTYRKTDGQWRIATLTLTRLSLDIDQ